MLQAYQFGLTDMTVLCKYSMLQNYQFGCTDVAILVRYIARSSVWLQRCGIFR
jgi:hypothetical protein